MRLRGTRSGPLLLPTRPGAAAVVDAKMLRISQVAFGETTARGIIDYFIADGAVSLATQSVVEERAGAHRLSTSTGRQGE